MNICTYLQCHRDPFSFVHLTSCTGGAECDSTCPIPRQQQRPTHFLTNSFQIIAPQTESSTRRLLLRWRNLLDSPCPCCLSHVAIATATGSASAFHSRLPNLRAHSSTSFRLGYSELESRGCNPYLTDFSRQQFKKEQ